MSASESADPSSEFAYLRIYIPTSAVFLGDLALLSLRLHSVHEACAWIARDFYHPELLLQEWSREDESDEVVEWTPPLLVVSDIGVGSLWMELVEVSSAAAGAGALWMVARVLRQGPGQLYEWAGLIPRAQAEWSRQRLNAVQERERLAAIKQARVRENERLLRAHEALIEIEEVAPGIEATVVDEQGQELPPPTPAMPLT